MIEEIAFSSMERAREEMDLDWFRETYEVYPRIIEKLLALEAAFNEFEEELKVLYVRI
jgi:hypothetical protein